ncbi:hypothetical protein [Gilliamella sp. Gris1-4]|uniref:hypothetical protein n=1 Tax=Gilliamella sp. Gris1-4 TaxID=3120244 RepID=UPI00080DAF36|nr:hypothetical protein [Gilliamella apicola]OCG35099.1 hypothetical protein A9G31_08870 [Gilliamella apicola]
MYSKDQQPLIKTAQRHQDQFKENNIFKEIYSERYNNFLNKPNITNAKTCFNANQLASIFNAYKLFYVGCSRARNKLIILLDEKSMDSQTFNKQKNKFKDLGLLVS